MAERALAYARAQQVDLAGPLWGVTDWSIVDCTTVKVRDTRLQEFPGTGDSAALKVHNVLSGGCGAPVPDHFSPAREHASRPLTVGASWRGAGLRADLASARRNRLQPWAAQDVRVVIRRKDHWKPKVDESARGQLTQAFFPGTAREARLEAETLVLDGRAIDAAVHVGEAKHPLQLRRVGSQTPKGDGCFLTNLPPRIGPRQVAARSRVRWEVDLRITRDKSVHRLDAIDAERPCSVKTLLQASLIASPMAARLAHTPNRQTRPQQTGGRRTQAPLHTRRLAVQLAVSCQSIAQAVDVTGAEATRRWDK
ncbi:MAG: hypothetical protein ACRD08_21215, partial [Acidimicrobiales bacterium]